MVPFNLAGYGVARDQRDGKAMWRLNDDLLGELALAFSATRTKGSKAEAAASASPAQMTHLPQRMENRSRTPSICSKEAPAQLRIL
jgi:hypothetical protein